MRHCLLILLCAVSVHHCETLGKNVPAGQVPHSTHASKPVVNKPTQAPIVAPVPDKKPAETQPQQVSAAADLPADPCLPFSSLMGGVPHYLDEAGVVITALLDQCQTLVGEPGYLQDSSWLAMNFPCTAGKGEVIAKPSYYGPKNVQFILASGCPGAPNTSNKSFIAKARKWLGVSEKAKLMAINPFMVQYWQVPTLGLAGTGSAMSIFDHRFLATTWDTMINKKAPLKVTLYGRENTWGAKDVFRVEGKLMIVATKEFKLVVDSVKVLTETELEQIRQECSKLLGSAQCPNYL